MIKEKTSHHKTRLGSQAKKFRGFPHHSTCGVVTHYKYSVKNYCNSIDILSILRMPRKVKVESCTR